MRKYLKVLRAQKGFKQSDVADLCGISRCYYCQIENSNRQNTIDVKLLAKLSDVFSVSVNRLVEYEVGDVECEVSIENTTPQAENYGQRLRKLREQMGMTQDELAKRAGFKNKASISKAETGDQGIPLKKVILIAKALNVTPAYLLGWEKGESSPAPTNNIKKLRLQHSMTQAEFGAIAGVSDKAVSTWEQELKNPRKNAIKKLAQHFGVSPAWLEGYTDDTTK